MVGWAWEDFFNEMLQSNDQDWELRCSVPKGAAEAPVMPLLKFAKTNREGIDKLLGTLSTGEAGYFMPPNHLYAGIDGIYAHKEVQNGKELWHCWLIQVTKNRRHPFHIGQFFKEHLAIWRSIPKDVSVELDIQFFLVVPEESVFAAEDYDIGTVTGVDDAFALMKGDSKDILHKLGFPLVSNMKVQTWKQKCMEHITSMINVAILAPKQ